MKFCKKCEEVKPLNLYYKSAYGTPKTLCMECDKRNARKRDAIYRMIRKHKVREEMNKLTIDLDDYKLTYYRIADNRKFLARRVSGQEYVLYDTVENKKEFKTIHFLRKEFVSCSDNFQRVKHTFQARVC